MLKKKKKSSKSKKKLLSQDVIIKASAESVTLKKELYGLLRAPGSVLSTMLKKAVRSKDQLLPFYIHIRNCNHFQLAEVRLMLSQLVI